MQNKAFSKIWILIILVAFIIGGILAWQYWWSPEEIKEGIADWETYRDRTNGFEIKYPQDGIITDLMSGSSLGSPGVHIVSEKYEKGSIKGVAVVVEDNPSQLSPRAWWDLEWDPYHPEEEFIIKDITLANNPAIEVIMKAGPTEFFRRIFVAHDRKIYHIFTLLEYQDEREDYFEQMLSTFSFLD